MTVRDVFDEEELAAVRAATKEAERRTGAELVCVIAARCDDYQGALAKGAALGAVGGAAAATLAHALRDTWLAAPAAWIGLPAVLGAGLGLLVALCVPAVRRALAGAEVLARRSRARALEAFLDEDLDATRDRTGVLVFLALFEHRLEILCDRGVRARVPEEAWQPIAEEAARGMRAGRPEPALCQAIAAAGELLARHGVERRADDVDELPDEPRIYDA